jgi:hypothetical protein
VFTSEEIQTLKKQKFYTNCLVSSATGKIIYISYVFNTCEPKADMGKLYKLKNLIKEGITIKLFFSREIKKEGYYLYSIFPVHLTGT